jgi:hypothetical protein
MAMGQHNVLLLHSLNEKQSKVGGGGLGKVESLCKEKE